MSDGTAPDFADFEQTKADIDRLLAEADRLESFRRRFWADRKRALNEAFEFVNGRIRPVVNEDIQALRDDERLEPKPGYTVSGQQYVNQTLAVAHFLFGDMAKTRDARYGDYSTYPRKVKADDE